MNTAVSAADSAARQIKKIGLAADHAGFALKARLVEYVTNKGYQAIDLGPATEDRVDYPDYGYKLAEAIAKGDVDAGIGICGSGIGISIALNRFAAVRAALCHDVTTAQLARQHNNANVLVMGARLIGPDIATACVDTFLNTAFEGGRHAGRTEKLGQKGCSL
ncbi:MAG: ribose 5-phosphate isomerase B [Alphaproteobacteria bacterium]|jgi:ribose 5-phosphate isomerase B